MRSENLAGYYARYMLQRLSLLGMALYSVIVAIVIVNVVFAITSPGQGASYQWWDRATLAKAATQADSFLSAHVVAAVAIATALGLLVVAVPRLRRLVDTVVVTIFCLFSLSVSQFAAQYFIQLHLGWF